MIQQPPKPGALIRPPQVTLTQTPMVALRQPHSRIVLTAPPQIQLNQLQPGEGPCGPGGGGCLGLGGQGLQGQTPLDPLVLPQALPALGRAPRALGEEAPEALPLPTVLGGASGAESRWVATGERGCPHRAQSPQRRVQRPWRAGG